MNHGGSSGTSEEPGTVVLVQLVNCITVDSACNDALMNNGFASAVKNATCTEDSYSYAATKGTRKVLTCTVDRPGKCHKKQRRAHRQLHLSARLRIDYRHR